MISPFSWLLRTVDYSDRPFPLPDNYSPVVSDFLLDSTGTPFGIAVPPYPPTESLFTNLLTTTALLCRIITPSTHRANSRGKGIVFHFGYWEKHSRKGVIYLTKDSRPPEVNWWRNVNYPLWVHASALAKQYFPKEYILLNRILAPMKFGIWVCAAVNIQFPSVPHVDTLDHILGLCCVIVLGVFIGGQLCFTENALYVPCEQGTIIIFRSATKEHFVANFIGYRHSVTLFTPKEFF